MMGKERGSKCDKETAVAECGGGDGPCPTAEVELGAAVGSSPIGVQRPLAMGWARITAPDRRPPRGIRTDGGHWITGAVRSTGVTSFSAVATAAASPGGGSGSGCSEDAGSAGMSTAFRPWSAGAVRRLLALKLRGREEEQQRRTRAAVARVPEGTGRPDA